MTALLGLAAVFGTAVHASALLSARTWEQCGGMGYTGPTTCSAGNSCVVVNAWYYQCQPGSAPPTSTSTAISVSRSSSVSTKTSSSAISVSRSTTLSTKTSSSTRSSTSTSTKSSSSPTGTSTATYRFLGRVNPATRELTWPASGITFSFTGTSASVPITRLTGTNAIEMVIDNGAPIINNNVDGSSTSISTGTLAQGAHTVSIRKKSEALFGSIFIGEPTVTGTFTPVSTPRRHIEIIGDSISVGYGLDGVYPCTNTAALEDAPLTYGALAATSLSADYSIVAWSGKGLTRNYVTTTPDTSPLMPELWTRYGANDADNTFDFSTPMDAVVINLGTNDFSYLAYDASGTQYAARPQLNQTAYTAAMVSFGRAVLSKYPSAQLFLTSSPMLGDSYPTAEEAQHTAQSNALKAAVAQIGTAKAHFVDFPSQDSSGNNIGCDYHPSAKTHQQMAAILTSAIQAVIGA